MVGDTLKIDDVEALWDGIELSLTFTIDSLTRFSFSIAREGGDRFSINPGFGQGAVAVEVLVTNGPVKVVVEGNSITFNGGRDALTQIARNIFNLVDMASEKGVTHMHFDPTSDADLVDADSAAFVICLDMNPHATRVDLGA
jgi:hypothetical protein